MKVKIVRGMSGKEIKLFTPETEEDLAILKAMEESGKVTPERPNDRPANQP